MPYKNRVDPFGSLVQHTARGTLMGNRGCLHDATDHPLRQYQSRRWIVCVLDFKNRKRDPMPPGHYTALFFLDEATARIGRLTTRIWRAALRRRSPRSTPCSIASASATTAHSTRRSS